MPEIATEEKASKLVILTKAAKYCRSLSAYDARVTAEMLKNVALRKKLHQLTSASLANLQPKSNKTDSIYEQKSSRKRSIIYKS